MATLLAFAVVQTKRGRRRICNIIEDKSPKRCTERATLMRRAQNVEAVVCLAGPAPGNDLRDPIAFDVYPDGSTHARVFPDQTELDLHFNPVLSEACQKADKRFAPIIVERAPVGRQVTIEELDLALPEGSADDVETYDGLSDLAVPPGWPNPDPAPEIIPESRMIAAGDIDELM